MTRDDRIPAILERVDLAAEVERRSGPPRRLGSTLTFRCPHPDHDDRNPSFTVKDGRATCWSRCSWSGDIIDLIVWLDHCTKADAIDQLARQVGLDRPELPRARPPSSDRRLLERFCATRQWEPDVLEHELGVCAFDTDDGGRVRFPLRLAGQEASYQLRRLGPGRPKWLSAKGIEIPCPYNADSIARGRQVGAAFVVEGIADTVALLHEWPDAAVVGCPGSGLFKQRWAAAFAGIYVFVVGDNDDAGRKFRADVTAKLTVPARSVWHIYVPEAFNDLDEWRQDDVDRFEANFLEAVARAVPLDEIAA